MNDPYSRAPHRPAASADAHSPHAALLIDFDNVTMGIRSNLGQELRKLLDSDMIRGKVSIQRAYADWRRYPQYIASLSEASIDLIFAPAYGSTKKNATDIRLAIDALEIVFIRPEIGTFILLSGDSDFSSLVLKLKEYGKYVIGVGIQESSSDLLVQNCDEYYSYNSLSGLTSASDMQNIEKHDPWVLAAKAIRRMKERGDVMRSDRFKQVMLELDPGFDEKSIGFSKFNRFLTESASRGILDLQKAANGQYEVAIGARVDEYANGGGDNRAPSQGTAKSAPRKESDESRGRRRSREDRGSRSARGQSRERSGRSREAREPDMSRDTPPSVDEDRLRAAYELLQAVVAGKAGSGGAVRDSEVKRHMVERDPGFDEAALGFRKFSRFLRQAHDEEVINLERTDEGNFKVAVVDGAGKVERGGTPPDASAGEDREAKGRGRGRRDRSGSRSDRKAEDTAPEGDAGTPAEDAGTPAEEAEAPQPGDHADSRTVEHASEETRPSEGASPDSRPSGRERSRLAGRKRHGSKPGTGPSVVPGPVDSDARDSSGRDEAAKHADGDETAVKEVSPTKPATRSMGMFRRGSRGPGGTASGAGRASSTSTASAGADSGADSLGLVERMARGYQGVGRRTAERLVEEFGDRVLEVIDNEPEKIEDVLPKGRAQAVIDGRRAELEDDGDAQA